MKEPIKHTEMPRLARNVTATKNRIENQLRVLGEACVQITPNGKGHTAKWLMGVDHPSFKQFKEVKRLSGKEGTGPETEFTF